MESKSYVKVMTKKGVSGGVGFESELLVAEGTSEQTMKDLIDKSAELNKYLLDKIKIG